MTSVSHRQAASYNASYEMSPKPASTRHEDSAQTQDHSARHSDSVTPRPPVTAEQRGQFSTHGRLVNPASSTTGADSARLAQLSQQNAQLRDGIQKVIEHFTPIITQLRQQVAELTQKANGAGSPGEKTAAPSEQGVRGAEHRESPDEAAAPAKNAQASGHEAPHDFQQVVAENNQLRETVERLQTQFTTVVTQLQEQIQALSQKLGGAGAAADQAPASTSGADASSTASPNRAADEEQQDASPAQSNEAASTTNRSVDDLMRDNQQLHAQLQQMVTQFTQVISQLKQQIEQLSAQVKAKTA